MSRYQNLLDEIDLCKPKSILEIGTWDGGHAAQMVVRALKYNKQDEVIYYGFDLWEQANPIQMSFEFCPKTPAKMEDAELRLAATGIEYRLIQGNTKDTLPEFNQPVDFIFMDGGHSIDTISSDWKNIQNLFKEDKSTVLIMDDYYANKMNKGCKFLIEDIIDSPNWKIEFLEPIDQFVGFSVQMIKVTQR